MLPAQSDPSDEARAFLAQYTSRNRDFIPAEVQERLWGTTVLVAGCGCTGGAYVEALLRIGVGALLIADDGAYELSNLNRQHATVRDIGRNKAEVQGAFAQAANPHMRIEIHPEGITHENVLDLTSRCDLVLDAVDVTTPNGIQMKIALHEASHRHRRCVFTSLNLGFVQFGQTFDYRRPEALPFDGNLDTARAAKHPLKALFAIVPFSAVPDHCLPMVLALLRDADRPASQLGCTADMLRAIIATAVVRFAWSGEAIPGWSFDLSGIAMPSGTRPPDPERLREAVRELLEITP